MSRDVELDETEPAAPEATVDASARRALKGASTDKLARAVAMSKISGALFAKREPVKLGRYHLLEQVGAGGMGVVWGAWDPELDRRVAIKVVKPELAAARERIVREGQALAKLSNPHVVPVYDVGVVDEQVYLVMEWVRGETLRAWATKPRTIEVIVSAYREAALGLAAAHDTGLVHRDFKPENAMIGADGRVRVLDFGLAQAGGESSGIAGTPRYMAPEQQVPDGTLTAAVDQYAVGISLKETLPAPPPKWLALIIARATATEPSDRFPTMHALVAALGNDPARIRRRRIAIAGALGLAGATFAIGTRAASDGEERCAGGPAEIGAVWNLPTRETLRAHLITLGPYGVQLARLATNELDGYASRWVATQKAACRASDRGELTPALYTSQLACLTRAKVTLATTRDVLTGASLERLPDAAQAVSLLPAVERCRTDTTPPPPAAIASRVSAIDNDIARARVLALVRDPRAVEVSGAVAKAADEVGYARQIGHAALVQGIALLLQDKHGDAIASLEHSSRAALEANDNATAVEAIARQLYALMRSDAPDTKVTPLALAESIAKGLDGDGAFARALYANNLGLLRGARGDVEGARYWLREAARVRPPVSRDTFELSGIYGNLGLFETDGATRLALFEREATEKEAALGADHPSALDARLSASMYIENPQRTMAQLSQYIATYRAMHPHLSVAAFEYHLAWIAEEVGDLETARALFDRIQFVGAGNANPAALVEGYRMLLAGDDAGALAAASELATKLAASDSSFLRARSVDANILAALAAEHLRDDMRVVTYAEAALATIDKLGPTASRTYIQRRRGRVLAMLAMHGGDRVAERKQAALAWARLAGGYDSRIAALTKR